MNEERKAGKDRRIEGQGEVIGSRGRYCLIRFEKADGGTGYLLEEDGKPASSDDDGDEFYDRVGIISGAWEHFLATRAPGEVWAEREPIPSVEEDEDQAADEAEGESLFGPVIFAYTRKQAIADGVLIDVTETAREAGFKVPVAVTHAVWARYVAVPEGVEGQDEKGRLWDILWMCRLGIALGTSYKPEVSFRLHVRNDNRERVPPTVTLKAVCGPDDDASPCVTIMEPHED
jgi:hypothetical protein